MLLKDHQRDQKRKGQKQQHLKSFVKMRYITYVLIKLSTISFTLPSFSGYLHPRQAFWIEI